MTVDPRDLLGVRSVDFHYPESLDACDARSRPRSTHYHMTYTCNIISPCFSLRWVHLIVQHCSSESQFMYDKWTHSVSHFEAMILFNIVCIKPSNRSRLKRCHLAIKSELPYGSQFSVMIVRSVGFTLRLNHVKAHKVKPVCGACVLPWNWWIRVSWIQVRVLKAISIR